MICMADIYTSLKIQSVRTADTYQEAVDEEDHHNRNSYFNSDSETNEHEPAVCRRYNDNMITGQEDEACTNTEEILLG